MRTLEQTDKKVYEAIQSEIKRQQDEIELIASENFVTPAVMEAMGTVFTNKYAEGYPGRRYYAGCENADIVEDLAIERLCQLFDADHANVQPHSGANANIAVYSAFLEPGDTVLGMNLNEGGHLTHGSPVNFSGKTYNFVAYGLDPKSEELDYNALEKLAKEHKPKMIVAGASAYPLEIDFERIGKVAKEIDAVFMVDMAHIAGLIAAGIHQNPFPHADIVTTTTHKTLRGPRGGAILCKEEFAKKIDSSVFPGLQGGPLVHVIAAKAVSFKEAQEDEFKDYIEQVVKNAKAMADEFVKSGIRLVGGGTDTHLILLDLTGLDQTGKDVEERLKRCHITTNKNTIPNDPESPFVTSGIRIGTPPMTTRGMKEEDMRYVAKLIVDVIKENRPQDEIKKDVLELLKNFPLYEDL